MRRTKIVDATKQPLKVIYLLPQSEPHEITVTRDPSGSSLRALQGLVGGLITGVRFGDLFAFANDEGLLMGLQPNIRFKKQLYVGPLVFTRNDDEGETISTLPGDLALVEEIVKASKRPGRFDYGY